MPFNPGLNTSNVTVQIENIVGDLLNPATEETLQSVSGFNIPAYDYIGVTTETVTDIYVFKTGGSIGTTVGTLTVEYTDSSKETLVSVTKS